MNLLSFEGYQMLSESADTFSKELDNILNENIGAALGSPIKFFKIKNNAKKYQQALVQIAINNLDFEKKKQAGTLDKDKLGVLTAANKQKNTALRDKADAISARMDQLATTDGLKTVSSIAKNKSKMAAAETALKTADGEEAKALKLRIQGLNAKVAADQRELKDYQKNAEEKEPGEVNQQNLDNVKRTPEENTTDNAEGGGTNNADGDDTQGKTKKIDKKIEELKNKVNEFKQRNTELENDPKVVAARKEQDDADDKYADIEIKARQDYGTADPRYSEITIKAREERDKVKKAIEDKYKDIEAEYEKNKKEAKKLEDEIKKLEGEKEKLKENMSVHSAYYVNESVASKFRRLMENKF
jgi:hypothetical protein